MQASTLAVVLGVLVAACAKASDNPPVVTAPVASGVAPASVSAAPAPTDAGPAPSAEPAAATDTADAGLAAFQACQSDADCIAVPRAGCCNNGWKEAVNATQKDAYAAAFACHERKMCPMYIVRDTRQPKCDPGTHLCTMVRPPQP
jgi:hypothetical protein